MALAVASSIIPPVQLRRCSAQRAANGHKYKHDTLCKKEEEKEMGAVFALAQFVAAADGVSENCRYWREEKRREEMY